MSAFQTLVLDEKGSDCRTKHYMKVTLDDSNKKLLVSRYFKTGSTMTELTNNNIDEHMNKVLEFRSPMFCQSERICNICAGELPYDMGIQNIGLLVNQVAQSIVTGSMKSFHDMTIKLNEVDFENYID